MAFDQSEHNKKYWKENKERLLAQRRHRYKHNKETKAKSQAAIKRVQAKRQKFLLDLLAASACVDCGEDNILVLEFDHCRGTKHREVTSMVSQSLSEKRIQEEIDKCDIVCANCHKIRTFSRLPNCARSSYILK